MFFSGRGSLSMNLAGHTGVMLMKQVPTGQAG